MIHTKSLFKKGRKLVIFRRIFRVTLTTFSVFRLHLIFFQNGFNSISGKYLKNSYRKAHSKTLSKAHSKTHSKTNSKAHDKAQRQSSEAKLTTKQTLYTNNISGASELPIARLWRPVCYVSQLE